MGRETGRTVITAVELDEVALVEDIVQTREGAAELIGGPAGGRLLVLRAEGEVQALDLVGEEVGVVGVDSLITAALIVPAGHGLQVMLAEGVLVLAVDVGREIAGPVVTLGELVARRVLDGLEDAVAVGIDGLGIRGVGILAGELVGVLLVGEVSLEAQGVVEPVSREGGGVLEYLVDLGDAALSVEQVTDGVDAGVGQGAVRVEDGLGRVAFVRDVAVDDAGALGVSDGVVILVESVVQVVGDLQPGEYLVSHLRPEVVGVVAVRLLGAVEQSVIVVVAAGEIVVELAVASGQGKVVVGAEDRVLVQGPEVVDRFRIIDVTALAADGTVGNDRPEIAGLVPSLVFLEPGQGELLGLVDTGREGTFVIGGVSLVEMIRPDIAVRDDVRYVLGGLHGEVGGVGHLGLALLGFLRGDEHDAVSGAGTVDGRSGGILQDGDGLDVVRVEHRRVALDAVDEDQCAAAVDGTGTTDVEGGGTSGLTVGQGDVEVGDGAFQHLGDVGGGTSFEHFAGDLLDRTGQVDLLGRAVTDDDGFIQDSRVIPQGDADGGLAGDRHFYGLISDEGYDQDSILGNPVQDDGSLGIRNAAQGRALHHDTGSGHRAGIIGHDTFNASVLGEGGHSDRQAEQKRRKQFEKFLHRSSI